MTSTSCRRIALEVLERSIAGEPPSELPPELLDEACGAALFGILAEGLGDRFEPALCDVYARLFSQAIAHAREGVDPAELAAHYERVRRPRAYSGNPPRVFVLSRVTLGADVAVTSVLLAAAKERFPAAEMVFAGPRKNYEMFEADPRIRHAEVRYRRGSLPERLAAWDDLKEAIAGSDALVIDPDSRLTQLGLLPVCPEDRYRFFESRAYGGGTDRTLPELASAWAGEIFGVTDARPYVALPAFRHEQPYIAVSLGVGENPAKRLPDPFEEELLRLLAGTRMPIWIDRGAGGEESERVALAVERSGARVSYWEGSFAGFASIVASSRLFAGYDSAAQHVAAASGVPLISIFAGFAVPRMFDRWRPGGPNCRVIRVEHPKGEEALDRVSGALRDLLGR